MKEKLIGGRVRRLREGRAWTQEHLAEKAHVSPRTVQRAEEGAMSADTLGALATALGTTGLLEVLEHVDPPTVGQLVLPAAPGVDALLEAADGRFGEPGVLGHLVAPQGALDERWIERVGGCEKLHPLDHARWASGVRGCAISARRSPKNAPPAR